MVHNPAMRLTPHGREWYDRLATLQPGYYYPWVSQIAAGNGEDAYLDLVRRHVRPEHDVLDAGCGHGEVTLQVAAWCRAIRGYDRVDRYVQLARDAARQRGVGNATFYRADSRSDVNAGRVRVPALDASIDLVISRRGPTHWIEDARRFCRPGAVLIQLNPLAWLEEPAWNRDLPDGLRLTPPDPDPDAGMRAAIERRLALADLRLHSAWTFDVPEWFADPRELYKLLTFGCAPDEVPSWRESADMLADVHERHAGPQGLACRHRRFLWLAVVE